jgi:hypothetical protein
VIMPHDATLESWAILELMGHRRLAGYLREVELAGGKFLRLDIPAKDGEMLTTQLYSPSAVYCITPTTEEIARAVAAQNQPSPVHLFELRQLQGPREEAEEGNIDRDDLGYNPFGD